MLLWLANLDAAAPQALKRDLSDLSSEKMMLTVDSMPAQLKRTLARTFHQKKLEMSDPQGPLGSTELIMAGDRRGFAPMRRLLFAFETKHFYYVYYEKGHPEGGASPIVFRKHQDGTASFVWGGFDENAHYAKKPQELASRILAGRIRDNLPFIW